MKLKTISLLLAFACTSSLPAYINITVQDNVPNGSVSGGSGSGGGLLSTTHGSILSNVGMPLTTYTVSGLDFTSIGGTAAESFTFTINDRRGLWNPPIPKFRESFRGWWS